MDLTQETIGGKYDLDLRLGGGGTASVYRAKRPGTRERVAVKVIPTSDRHAERLVEQEVTMLRQLNHPNIVRFIEDGHDGRLGVVYLVLEYVDGVRIRDHVHGAPSVAATLDLFQQILDAINHAHGRGVVHRDIKPDNVLVVTGEDRPLVKVLDFGIAGITTTVAPQHTIRSYYTPYFAPPEQLRGDGVQRPADLYSAALLFLFLLAGQESQDEMLRGGGKKVLYEPAKAALGDGEAARALHKVLLKVVEADDPQKRPRLPDLQLHVRMARDEVAERTPLPLYLTRGLRQDIDLKEGLKGAPGLAARYVREALTAGNNRTFASFRTREDGSHEIQLGNGVSGKAFTGVVSDDSSHVVLKREVLNPDAMLRDLAERGLRCSLDPQIVEFRGDLRPDPATVEAFVQEIRRISAQSDQNFRERQERKNNQTFAQWERLIDLKKAILDDEKLPVLKYEAVEHVEEDNVLRVRLAQPVELAQFDAVATSSYPVTITARDGRAPQPRQVSIGSVIGGNRKDGKVVAVEIGLSEATPKRLIDSILPRGEIHTDLTAQETVVKRERRAINDARFGRSLNPQLFHTLTEPAKAAPIQPVHVDRFYNERLDGAQREAVETALGTDTLFLIQGPPGTGKTSVITELILQILERHPSHRILVTSQSNIAVDNVLEKVAEVRPELRMIRFGDEEKVEPSARPFLMKPAVKGWQQQIAAKAQENWDAYARQHGHLLAGAEKVRGLQSIRSLTEERARVGRLLLEAVKRANGPYSPSQHATFVRLANELGGLLGEKSGVEEELREAIAAFAERYGAQPPDGSVKDWLDAEDMQAKQLLGENNEHYDRYIELQDLLLKWLERLEITHDDLKELYLEHVTVVGSTCIKIGAGHFKNLTFDWVIVDEAGRATPAETLVPAVKGRRVILVGDHKQLPPVVESELVKRANQEGTWDKRALEESLFEHLYNHLPPSNKRTLTNQYRMHPSIGNLVSELFYDRQISSDLVGPAEKAHGLKPFAYPVYWVTTSEVKPETAAYHRQPKGQGHFSFFNPYEARVVRALLDRIQQACVEAGCEKEVGVITAYASQRATLDQAIQPRNRTLWTHLDIVIHTVDGFQGKDRDIVIYNLVRNHQDRRLGFTADFRRLNVALSRAKELLFVVGNDRMAYEGRTPRGVDNPFRPLIDHILRPDTDCARELCEDFATA